MKQLVLLLASISPVFGSVSLSNVYVDHVSHGTGLVHFTSSGTTVPYVTNDGTFNVWFNRLKVCYSTTPGTCAGGGGEFMPTSYPTDQSAGVRQDPNFRVILTGLAPSTTYEVCPFISQDYTNWVFSCGTVTTIGLPSVHPAPAELPRNAEIPVVPNDYTGFHSGASTGQNTPGAVTTCANLQADIHSAQQNQASYGTVISLTPGQGSKCSDRYFGYENPPDVHTFGSGDVNTGNSTINWAGSGLTEGAGVQFSKSYNSLPGEYGTNPLDCRGIKTGQVYYAHFTNFGSDPAHFQLTCDYPFPKGRLMRFADAGGSNNLFVAPYPRRKDQGGALYPIIIRTATPDSQLPPPGTRMSPAWSGKLAVLQPDSLCGGFNCYYAPVNGDRKTFALGFGQMFDDGDLRMAANIWGVGLEIQSIDNTGDPSFNPLPTWNLVSFKQGTSDNGLDRCYIHGQYPFPSRLAWGITWDGHNNAILNSYFDRITYPFSR
jgi:hypothetical protein